MKYSVTSYRTRELETQARAKPLPPIKVEAESHKDAAQKARAILEARMGEDVSIICTILER